MVFILSMAEDRCPFRAQKLRCYACVWYKTLRTLIRYVLQDSYGTETRHCGGPKCGLGRNAKKSTNSFDQVISMIVSEVINFALEKKVKVAGYQADIR
jgi:hypothetical protein